MPDIVSNTTPIISLLKIDKLNLLKELYSKIHIPNAVFEEVEAGRHKDYYTDLSKISWIKISNIKDKNSIKYFLDLDAGEAETIVLATEIDADLVILDEKLGRFHAKHADLKVTGTIGVLAKAKKEGLTENLKPIFFELKEKGVWISDKLINEILRQTGEN